MTPAPNIFMGAVVGACLVCLVLGILAWRSADRYQSISITFAGVIALGAALSADWTCVFPDPDPWQ